MSRNAKRYSPNGRPARGWPEQEPVREAFRRYLEQFSSQIEAAAKIGCDPAQVSDWKNGQDRIPEWFCEYLGFRMSYVPIEPVRFTPLAMQCLDNEAKRDRRIPPCRSMTH